MFTYDYRPVVEVERGGGVFLKEGPAVCEHVSSTFWKVPSLTGVHPSQRDRGVGAPRAKPPHRRLKIPEASRRPAAGRHHTAQPRKVRRSERKLSFSRFDLITDFLFFLKKTISKRKWKWIRAPSVMFSEVFCVSLKLLPPKSFTRVHYDLMEVTHSAYAA